MKKHCLQELFDLLSNMTYMQKHTSELISASLVMYMYSSVFVQHVTLQYLYPSKKKERGNCSMKLSYLL